MALDDYFENYCGVKGTVEERVMTKATTELVLGLSRKKNVLNLGLGNGFLSRILADEVNSLTVVEGSVSIIDRFSFPHKSVTFVESYFEDYLPENKFDLILANHVLEHVSDPVCLMKNKFNDWVVPNGIIYITVPNARSIHRLIGKQMGLLDSEYDLNKSDIRAGHQRVYDKNMLVQHITGAGLKIVDMGGYNLKMVSLEQMKDWSQELLDAIFEVSKVMPLDICSNLWVKARLP